jgi:hypothetical protein
MGWHQAPRMAGLLNPLRQGFGKSSLIIHSRRTMNNAAFSANITKDAARAGIVVERDPARLLLWSKESPDMNALFILRSASP